MPGSSSTGVRRVSMLLIEMAVVGLAAVAVAFVVLRLWHADMRVPFVYNGDGIFNSMLVKGIIDNGWFQHNPHLGFPFGQNLLDYPSGADHLHFVAMRVLAFGTRDAGVVMNVFYLGTYFVDAAAAYIAVRLMGRARATAAVVALLFAFLPYHVFRGENHIFLSGYEGIPLAGLLLYWVFQTRPVLFDPEGPALLRNRRALAAIVIALLLGATGAYYGVFTALPLFVAAVVGIPAGWGWRRCLSAFALSALVGLSLVLNLAPSIAYRVVHGTDLEATHKDPVATEAFGLKISQLVLPVQGHRIDRLAALQQRSFNPAQPSEGAQQLGAVGAIGFVGLIGWGLARLVRRDPGGTDQAVAPLAFGTVVLILTGTIGGFSMVLALGGLTEIRSWNRVSVMIAFFSFAFVALSIERGTHWLANRRPGVMRGGIALAVALTILFVGGLVDETTPAALPDYAASKARYVRERAFVRRVEASLPKGAALFQLPYIPFPETPARFQMNDYDHVRGFLHSRDLNWSYGEVKGRHGDWQDGASALPPDQMIPALVGAGFSAIWIDTAGYEDHAAALSAALAARLGPPLETSPFQVFDLRKATGHLPDAARIKAAGDAVIHPVETAYPAPWGPAEYRDGHTLRAATRATTIALNNSLGRARSVTVSLLAQGSPGPIRLSISRPGGRDGFDLGPTLQPVTLRFTLPANGGRLRFEGTGAFVVADVHVTDDAVAAAAIAAT